MTSGTVLDSDWYIVNSEEAFCVDSFGTFCNFTLRKIGTNHFRYAAVRKSLIGPGYFKDLVEKLELSIQG